MVERCMYVCMFIELTWGHGAEDILKEGRKCLNKQQPQQQQTYSPNKIVGQHYSFSSLTYKGHFINTGKIGSFFLLISLK